MRAADVEIANEMKRLVRLIRHHNRCFFQKSSPEISDYAYDQLVERLALLEGDYPHLKEANSPLQEIGEKPSKAFQIAHHHIPMLSLAKTYLEAEVIQFIERVRKTVPDATINFICEPKIDGVALSIHYAQGKLIKVVTRGDGEKGDVITQHALDCMELPTTINNLLDQSSFEVRGEAFMPKDVFRLLNDRHKAAGLPLWANPRNITAGTLKALNADLVQGRQLAFYGYSLYAPEAPCATQQEALELLIQLGFPVVPTYKVCHNIAEIMAYIDYWHVHKKDLPVDIDGMVIKVNEVHCQKHLGATSKAPRWAIAYKYKPERASSILEDITFQVGRSGAVTPVAHFQPIALAGTVVRRASLYNANELVRREFHRGDVVFIEKGGEIIPKIVGIDGSHRSKTSVPIAFVRSCPSCATPLYREVGEAIYYCPNKQRCLPQFKGALLHFAHRKAMDIPTLGPRTVDALLAANLVTTAADLYSLGYASLSVLDGFQERSIRKLLVNIQASKAKSFDKLLFALGIKYVGETVAKKLALYFKSMEQLQGATWAALVAIPDVGAIIAKQILAYFQDPHHQESLAKLQEAGLQFALPDTVESGFVLSSKNFVISGVFQQFTRTELTNLIEQAGGNILSTVSAKADYLVMGTKSGSAKLAKATELAIPILGEEDIMHFIRYGSIV